MLIAVGIGRLHVSRMTPPAPDDSNASQAERELSGHIFAVSAGLIGVCLTVIGVFLSDLALAALDPRIRQGAERSR